MCWDEAFIQHATLLLKTLQKCCHMSCFWHSSDSHIRICSSNTVRFRMHKLSQGPSPSLVPWWEGEQWPQVLFMAAASLLYHQSLIKLQHEWLFNWYEIASKGVKHINTEGHSNRITQVWSFGNSHQASISTFNVNILKYFSLLVPEIKAKNQE